MYALNFLDSKGNEVLHLVQWDLGRKLYLENTEELTNAPVFLFFNRKSETSIPVASTFTDNGLIEVEVPNDLLQYPYTVMVHMYEYEDASHNCTVAKGVLPVTAKIKPSYYEYVDNIENVIESLVTTRVDNRLTDFELTYLANLDDGSPKGTFTSVAGLSGKPNGIYVYSGTDNTSASPQLKQGWIYFWDGTSISDPIIQYQAVAIANGTVTYDTLDATLKAVYDEYTTTDYIEQSTETSTISSTTALNDAKYCASTLLTHFVVSGDLAEALGLDADESYSATITYVAPYQIIEIIDIGVTIVRKINSISPTFSAEDWITINPSYTKSESDELLGGKFDYALIGGGEAKNKAYIDSLTLDNRTAYKALLAAGVLFAGSASQYVTILQYGNTIRSFITEKDGIFYTQLSNDTWGALQPALPVGGITEEMLSPSLVMKALEEKRIFDSSDDNFEDLEAYLATDSAKAGQVVVVEDGGKYKVYTIQPNGNSLTYAQASAGCYIGTTLSGLEGDPDLDYYIGTTTTGFIHYRYIIDEATPEGDFIAVGGDSYDKTETYTKEEIDSRDTAYDFAIADNENDETQKILQLINTQDDSVIASVILPAGGGGGAGGVSVMRLRNLLPSTSFTVPYDGESCECILSFLFTSTDSSDNTPTGNGVAYYYVDGELVLTNQNLEQGTNNVDLGAYVTPNKTNVIRVTVVDMDGNRKSLTYYANVAYNYITSNFPKMSVQNGAFSIACTPNGSGSKVITCKVDGVVYDTITTTTSAAARYFDIVGLSHGSHTIQIYMDTTLEGYSGSIRSNTLNFGILQVVSGNENKLLFAQSINPTLTQYDYAQARYVAYGGLDPSCILGVSISHKRVVTLQTKTISNVVYYNQSELAAAGLSVVAQNPVTITETEDDVTITYVRKADTDVVTVDGVDYTPTSNIYSGTLNVDSGAVSDWSYRLTLDGVYTVVFSYYYEVGEPTGNPSTSGYYELSNGIYTASSDSSVNSEKTYYTGLFQTLTYTATALDVATAETSGLKFLFDPTNRSNNEPNETRATYSFTNSNNETYSVVFDGIDFNLYGWTGNSLKIPLGGSMSIPFQPFSYDIDTTRGKTIEVSFKVTNVYDYEQNVISCFANNKGINITANKGSLAINSSDGVSVQYNDETEIRLSFVITKRNSANSYRGQLVYVFINSDIAGVINFAELDSFLQNPASNIIIGSDYAEIEVYKVRCYDIELFQVAQDSGNRSYQILNNFIADSPNVSDMLDRNNRNNVFDETYSIDYNKLPDNCPYMIIECPELPQYKGDKKTVSGTYVDKGVPSNSFIFSDAELNVQGTSSQGYVIKNFKAKFKKGIKKEIDITTISVEDTDYIPMSAVGVNGVEVTADEPVTIERNDITYVRKADTNVSEINGVDYVTLSKYQLYSNSVPTNAFCLKADVASSEGANNIILMKIWDDMTRWLQNDYDMLTPPQEEDERVRQCIDGKPIVVYWKNPNTNAITFWGKYNFNNDKGTPEVFGFDDTKYPNCEAWDFRDNGLVVTEFKSDDFETEIEYTDKTTGQTTIAPRAKIAFEPIFPDDETYDDYTQLKRVVSWVASTDTENATGASINKEINGVTYTTDNAAYRLAKFKDEFEDYFVKDLAILYYIWTDIFLMVDSRAKNQHMVTFDGEHWFFFPYDGDTALGIDNIGALVFDYWLEDDSTYNGSNVYNGQDSVLWKNVRAAFQTEIFNMINSLVSKGFNYEYVRNRFATHQSAWSEAIFCADTEHKYIKPYLDTDTTAYLAMAQGSKASQREYWLKHRFSYYFSKYMVGSATDSTNEIQLRMTTPVGAGTTYRVVENPSGNPSTSNYYEKVGNNTYSASTDTSVNPEKTYYINNKTIVITPFTNTYVIAEFGSTRQKKYCKANESVSFVSTLDSSGDSMLNIYNGAEIKSFGDLSDCHIKRFELGGMATNLESVIVGSEAEGYENAGLVGNMFSLGNSKKLKTVNISNCTNLTGNVNVSNCYNIREFLAKGTKITTVSLPSGSQLRTLKLPNTITNLQLISQTNLETFEIEGYDNLTHLTIQNTPVDVLSVLGDALESAPNLSHISLTDINWSFNQSQNANGIALMDKLAAKSAIQGYTVALTGTVHFHRITQRQYDTYTSLWNGLTITYTNFVEQYPVTFANFAAVASPTGNPSTSNYYELVNDEYVSSTDTSVDSEKTYYTGSFLGTLYVENGSTVAESWVITSDGYYVKDFRVVAEPTGNPSTSGYYELSDDTYAPSEDTTVNSGKTYYELYDYLFDTPKRDYTWDKTYAFYGWDSSPGTRIRAPKTYNTVFTESDRQYTITFESDGNELYSTDVTAGGTLTYDTTYGTPSKEEITDTWYLCQGWIDTGESIIVDGVTDTSKIVGLYSTFTVNEALVGDFVADKKDVLKPNYVINSIFLECCLPDFMSDPEPADVTQYLSEFTYVYTNDPNYESAYTIGEIYAICKSDKFDLYLRKGDRARIICPEWNAFIGGAVADEQSGRSAFEIEVMGYNVYERADSGFTGVGDTWDGLACPYGVSGDYYNQTILGKFASFSSSLTDLSEKTAGLYVCDADGCVYYWNNDGNYPTKVTQYFSHVVWALRFADSSGNNGQTFGGYPMNSGNVTTNGWGDDTADSSKKCRANEYLNDGILSGSTRGRSLFSYFPSELQGVITPVKVLSAKGRDSSGNFSNLPVSSISKLFLLSDAEVFGANSVPYRNELNKWCSLGVWSSNTLSSFKTYSRITGNNNRIKKPNYATGSASYWWLRSPYSTTHFVFVGTNGGFNANYANYSYGLAPAFCIG